MNPTDQNESLATAELLQLLERVFQPKEDDRALAILVDLPDTALPDNAAWRERRNIAASWALGLAAARRAGQAPFDVALFAYRNARHNNADLPAEAWRISLDERAEGQAAAALLPDDAGKLAAASGAEQVSFAEDVFARHAMLMAPTELSATAPLKLAAKTHGFRAATMGGFGPLMIPALRLDYTEIDRRCRALKARVDAASAATFRWVHAHDVSREWRLTLDLRHRQGHASGGLFPQAGVAGNLPSGESYIVPYEGERDGDPSRSAGSMPVQLDPTHEEIVVYRIVENRAVEVLGDGPQAQAEREHLDAEPAYGNVAELGLGVLADFGLGPIGEVMLDEKLGLHIAFGRSDHFGGQVGAKDFSSAEAVIHIDRVYIPETMPLLRVAEVDLVDAAGHATPLMRDGTYTIAF
jgi:leucyl aminopeptidase (aminopeptidase T)